MRYDLAVDLAPRYSAAVCADEDGMVDGFGVMDLGPINKAQPGRNLVLIRDWAESFIPAARKCYESGGRVIVEDLSRVMDGAKPSILVQGGFLLVWAEHGIFPEMVMARTWQLALGYKKKDHGTTKAWAKNVCLDLGYEAKMKGKASVDLRDAYLMTHWSREFDVREAA